MCKCTDADDHKWEVYKDKNDKWRWKRTAKNGSIVGASTQGYVNKSDCIDNAKLNGCDCTL